MTQELKVFEFAKEIGIETLTLMDKLRKWDIGVKSHMATLDSQMIEKIKTKMAEEDAAPAAAPAKKVVAKKAATKKTAKVAAAPTPVTSGVVGGKAAKASTKKPAARRKAAAEDDSADAGKKVIRRKALTEAEKKAVEDEKLAAQQRLQAEAEAEMQVSRDAQEAVSQPQAEAAIQDSATNAESGAAQVAAAPQTEAPSRPKNIVGRMDLSKVESFARNRFAVTIDKNAPRGERPQSGGYRPGQADSGGFRPRPATGGTGTGFNSASQMPPPAFNPFGDNKDKSRKKLSNHSSKTEEPARTVEPEEEVFIRTDFRKREAIFQPKKKRVNLGRDALKTQITKPKALKRVVKVFGTMSVLDLAAQIKVAGPKLVTHLMKEGITAKITDSLDFDTISLIVPHFDFEAVQAEKSVDQLLEGSAYGEMDAELVSRAPVVTVMGHVDHGKTSLLDAIRKADVAAGEAGGITQHIGAYRVKLEDGSFITFLDTPGHEAFTSMRARGAQATDIAVIVIAADDGVMPQTAEAINHAKAAGVPIIVAMNKMDRPGANAEKIKQQVMEFELVPEEWGGSNMFIGTSAAKKEGIKELLEAIHLQAELLELKANPKRSGTGIVIESRMEKGRGPVATVLVQDGTLHKGDYIVAGTSYGRTRALTDDKAKILAEAGPGIPVEVLGLNSVPSAGDKFDVVADEKKAQEVVSRRQETIRKAAVTTPQSKMTLEELFGKVQEGECKELPVVLKTDVAGSIEAIRVLFDKASTPKVKVKIIHSGVGGVTESDVLLASSANAMVIGFNTRPDGGASTAAAREGVQIKTYSIVYELADDIRNAMRGMLAPIVSEENMGRVEVREIFKVPNVGTIAGSFVTQGKVTRDALVRLLRDGVVVYTGKIGSLRRFKDQAKEVAEGYECGVSIENFNDLKVGDVLEVYKKVETAAEL